MTTSRFKNIEGDAVKLELKDGQVFVSYRNNEEGYAGATIIPVNQFKLMYTLILAEEERSDQYRPNDDPKTF